uniref:Uncharacterized protein n=1 Tax=Triticum urartu TaxID=4572 RepID=A0A8R7QGL7_TRIUA
MPLFVGSRPSSASTPTVLPCRPFCVSGTDLGGVCLDRTSTATCRSPLRCLDTYLNIRYKK